MNRMHCTRTALTGSRQARHPALASTRTRTGCASHEATKHSRLMTVTARAEGLPYYNPSTLLIRTQPAMPFSLQAPYSAYCAAISGALATAVRWPHAPKRMTNYTDSQAVIL